MVYCNVPHWSSVREIHLGAEHRTLRYSISVSNRHSRDAEFPITTHYDLLSRYHRIHTKPPPFIPNVQLKCCSNREWPRVVHVVKGSIMMSTTKRPLVLFTQDVCLHFDQCSVHGNEICCRHMETVGTSVDPMTLPSPILQDTNSDLTPADSCRHTLCADMAS